MCPPEFTPLQTAGVVKMSTSKETHHHVMYMAFKNNKDVQNIHKCVRTEPMLHGVHQNRLKRGHAYRLFNIITHSYSESDALTRE